MHIFPANHNFSAKRKFTKIETESTRTCQDLSQTQSAGARVALHLSGGEK